MSLSLRDLRVRPFITGVLSLIPGLFSWWDKKRTMGNTASSAYCLGIWRFHLEKYMDATGLPLPGSVGELGPGASLGTGIAALLDGVQKVVALDAGCYADKNASLRILNELQGNSSVNFSKSELEGVVENAFVGHVAGALNYVAPWTDASICDASSLDLIFSHSVMEHVNDPAAAYKACYYWLRPGGLMSHRIDHSSHGITNSWDGYYSIPSWLWKIIWGKRPYLLNRLSPARHIDFLKAAGFEILPQTRFLCVHEDGLMIDQAELPIDPFQVKTSTILARKPA